MSCQHIETKKHGTFSQSGSPVFVVVYLGGFLEANTFIPQGLPHLWSSLVHHLQFQQSSYRNLMTFVNPYIDAMIIITYIEDDC